MADPVLPPADKIFVDEAGETVAVAPGFEREAIAQGLVPTETQYVKQGGDIQALSGKEAAAALQGSAFAKLVGGGDYVQNEERKEFESIGGRAGSFGVGAARGLTFGGSDWIGSELGGDDYRTYAKNAGLYNPGTVLTGEVAGMLAPALLTGGESAGLSLAARGARVATAPARLVFAGAEGVGNLATRGAVGLGAAEGGLAARFAGSAARGAVEGAVFGAGNEISKESLAGTPLNVDKIVASAAHTALVGSALSGGLTLAGAGFSRLTAGKAADGIERAAAREAGAVDGAVVREGESAFAAAEARAVASGATPEAAAAAGAAAKQGVMSTALAKVNAAGMEGAAAAGAERGESMGEKAVRWFEGASGEARSGKDLGSKAAQLSDEFAVKTLGAPRQKMRALYEQGDEAFARVAKMMREEVPELAGRPLGSLNKEEIARVTEGLKSKYGTAIDDVITRAETANGGKLEIGIQDLTKSIRRDLLEPLTKDPSAAAQEGWLTNWVERLEGRGEAIGWREMRDLRSSLDKRINWGQRTQNEGLELMKDLRGHIERRLIDAGEEAAQKAGGSFAKDYAAAKSGYSASAWATSAAEEADVRLLTNRGFGFSEQVGGAAFGNMGATAGAALAGPVGGIIGGGLGYLGGAYVNHQIRQFGAGIASDLLAKAATDRVLLETVAKASERIRVATKDAIRKTGDKVDDFANGAAAKGARFEGEVVDVAEKGAAREAGAAAEKVEAKAAAAEKRSGKGGAKAAEETATATPPAEDKPSKLRGVLGAVGEGGKRAVPGAASVAGEAKRESERRQANLEERYRRERRRVAELVSNPKRIEAQTAALAAGRPDLAAGVRAKLLEHAKWLQSQAPKNPASSNSLTPQLADTTPADTQMSAWLRKVDAVADPMRVIDDFGQGHATREGLNVLRERFPDLHAEIVTQIQENLASAKTPVPYEKRLQLGIMTGVPTDPTLDPSFMRAAQATFAEQPNNTPPPPSRRPPNLASAWGTAADSLAKP